MSKTKSGARGSRRVKSALSKLLDAECGMTQTTDVLHDVTLTAVTGPPGSIAVALYDFILTRARAPLLLL